MASRFVETHAMPWEATRYPGIEAKTLLVDRRTGLLTVLLKMAPGAMLPEHEHVRIEQTFVIEGALVCGEGTCGAGNFVWRHPGSVHEAHAPDGLLGIGIFQQPNEFLEMDGDDG